MTATNSQTISTKLVQRFLRKGLKRPLVTPKKTQGFSLKVALDGELTKRLFDILFSLTVLIFLSPLYLILSALIALSSPGPIFYVQQRKIV